MIPIMDFVLFAAYPSKMQVDSPEILSTETRLTRASLLMEAIHQPFLPVYSNLRPIGVITQDIIHDRLKSYELQNKSGFLSVGHHMLSPLGLITENMTAGEILSKFIQLRPKAFLFIRDGGVIGLLTLEGLLLALARGEDTAPDPFMLKWEGDR